MFLSGDEILVPFFSFNIFTYFLHLPTTPLSSSLPPLPISPLPCCVSPALGLASLVSEMTQGHGPQSFTCLKIQLLSCLLTAGKGVKRQYGGF